MMKSCKMWSFLLPFDGCYILIRYLVAVVNTSGYLLDKVFIGGIDKRSNAEYLTSELPIKSL